MTPSAKVHTGAKHRAIAGCGVRGNRLVESYRSVLQRVCSGEAYCARVRACLHRCRPQYRSHISLGHVRAMMRSILHQGILDRVRLSYWKFLLLAATRRSFGAAMTMAVMGYHFQMITEQIAKAEN